MSLYCISYSLGADHDGQDNLCSSDEQFIMASKPLPLTDEIYKNAFTFSDCTQKDIADKLNELTRFDNEVILYN